MRMFFCILEPAVSVGLLEPAVSTTAQVRLEALVPYCPVPRRGMGSLRELLTTETAEDSLLFSKIDFSIYRLFDEIDFSIIKNLPGNSTVGNFGQLGADGQLPKIFEQVQNRFHWDKALGGRQFCHSGKTVTPYSLLLLKDPAGGLSPHCVGVALLCPTTPHCVGD